MLRRRCQTRPRCWRRDGVQEGELSRLLKQGVSGISRLPPTGEGIPELGTGVDVKTRLA
jgi:hypothetical protein